MNIKIPELPSRIKFAVVVLLAFWIGGGLVYHYLENWRFIDCFYFSATTLTTVGFGDHVPKTDIGKVFTIFYMFIGIAIVFYALTEIGQFYFNKQFEKQIKNENKNGEKK